ncbi:MAG: response regulator transcription factor [Epsilonproteobacteria bacterium]|nr:response regulator transcription factor [Campylobacterota bacterium]
MGQKKILLLEDDLTLNETVTEYFEELGYDVDGVDDGIEALDKIYENSYDILLLDVKVPQMSGFDLLKEVRARDIVTPAIYITSLNSINDLSEGYESGCDDYIRKPFALKELLMRVETILKREFFHNNNEKITIAENIEYDINANLLYIDNIEASLNNKETKLLKLFLQNQNQVLSHERIYDTLWEYDETYSEASLRTYIKNLRKILGKEKIVSIKKQGYKFTTE